MCNAYRYRLISDWLIADRIWRSVGRNVGIRRVDLYNDCLQVFYAMSRKQFKFTDNVAS
jgi:hypothetical protein